MPEFSNRWMMEEREALQPEAVSAREFEEWLGLLAALREQLEGEVPEPEVIVFYALEQAGRAEGLTEVERRTMEGKRESVQAALDRHPGLQDVVDDIVAACGDFEAVWSSPSREAFAPDRSPHRSSRTRLYWQVAGALAVAVVLAVGIFLLRGDAPVVVTETGADEVMQLELVDGSMVRLMEESQLVHPAEEAFERRVELTGQAYFEVQPAETAFEVVTPAARALATGTSFGVRASEEETEVVLASGSITLSAEGEEVTLEPGQRSRALHGQAPEAPEQIDLAEELAWTGLLVFRQAPAREIAERLSASYGTSITVAPGLEEESVTGTFERQQPLEEVLGALAATLGAEIERHDDGFHLASTTD